MDRKRYTAAVGLLGAFVVWTVAVALVDVRSIGPDGSTVGLATLNGWFHHLTGVHWSLYTITDWLSLIPVSVAMTFAMVGLCQWCRRGQLRLVDGDVLWLGVFYVVVMGAYLLFETVVINHRPVLIDGCLEASYPSSTTVLVMCVMLTALRYLRFHIRRSWIRRLLTTVVIAFVALMVLGRLLAGVHWLSDIVGGGLLSGGLVLLYDARYCD